MNNLQFNYIHELFNKFLPCVKLADNFTVEYNAAGDIERLYILDYISIRWDIHKIPSISKIARYGTIYVLEVAHGCDTGNPEDAPPDVCDEYENVDFNKVVIEAMKVALEREIEWVQRLEVGIYSDQFFNN